MTNETRYLTADDLTRDAKPYEPLDNLYRELAKRDHIGLDPATKRRMEDWSFLNSKVVGAEEDHRR